MSRLSKGFIQAGGLIFVVLLLVVLGLLGYFYFGRASGGLSGQAQATTTDLATGGVSFMHPRYGYSLTLPYQWKGKYLVRELADRTEFASSTNPDFIYFSLVYSRAPDFDVGLGTVRRLAERDKLSYLFFVPEASTTNPQAGPFDRAALADTFNLPPELPAGRIKQLLLDQTSSADTGIRFAVYELLATRETGTTTEYYLWAMTQTYQFAGARVLPAAEDSYPAALKLDENGDSLWTPAVRRPRSGISWPADIKKIFPPEVRQSAVLAATTTEHDALMQKLTSALNDQVLAYFGSLPKVASVGLISGFSLEDGLPVVDVRLATGPAGPATSLAKKTTRLALAGTLTGLKLPNGTSTELVPLSDWGRLFGPKAASSWKKKAFWLYRQGSALVDLEPY